VILNQYIAFPLARLFIFQKEMWRPLFSRAQRIDLSTSSLVRLGLKGKMEKRDRDSTTRASLKRCNSADWARLHGLAVAKRALLAKPVILYDGLSHSTKPILTRSGLEAEHL
jgi:hypothetical protein